MTRYVNKGHLARATLEATAYQTREVLEAMNQPQAMANIMTPSISQKYFTEQLKQEVGHTMDAGCPFDKFLCLNSGLLARQ